MTLTRFQKKKRIHAIILVFIITLTILIFGILEFSDIYEMKTIDIRTNIFRKDKPLNKDIVVILVDESSLDAMNDIAGRWPWPRRIHAGLIDFLSRAGAETVIMDFTFFDNQISEHYPSGHLDINDKELAESTQKAGNVIHAMRLAVDPPDEMNKTILNRPMPEAMIRKHSIPVKTMKDIPGTNVFNPPFRQLCDVSAGIGVVSFAEENDSVSRREKIIFNYQGHYFPAHGLAPVLRRTGCDSVTLTSKDAVIRIKDGSGITIPLQSNGSYYVNMYGQYNTFTYSSVYQSLLKLEAGETEGLMVKPEEFNGKIVYVGARAAALEDLKDTSIGNAVPGVFLHASICGNILDRDFLIFTENYINVLIITIIVFMTVFSVLYFRQNMFKTLVPVILTAAYACVSAVLFRKNMVVPVFLPMNAALAAYIISFTYISVVEGKEKRKVKNILGQYVSPAMLSMVLDNSADEYFKAEVGSKENLTVFFSDIRGFTSISERYPAEKVVEVLNAYLSLMVDIIFENNGTLDKFIGDAIMAFWGAPVKLDDHAYKAVLSAICMTEALTRFNIENQGKGLPELKIGIGIHTDMVILGNIGSRKKLDYTVIGDGVNLTSRLESLTKTYASEILISQSTCDRVKDKICCRIADFIKVKGKDEPIQIYQVVGLTSDINLWDKTLSDKTSEAFELYRKGSFEAARKIYDSILETDPDDGLARIFSERCSEFMITPPNDNWDGCYVHKSK